MKQSRTIAAVGAVCMATIGLAVVGGGTASGASAAAPTYSVTSGSVTQVGHATDTPANPYIDKDGTFYFQQSAALYGASDARKWDFYTGTNMDTAAFSSAISNSVNPNDSTDANNNTTARCNNSPTGRSATAAPSGQTYSQRNYCDLSSVWVDPDTGTWYGLVHNEFTPAPFGDGIHYDAIDYAVSTDQGQTWSIKDHAITSPYSTTRGDTTAFPNQTYYYGDGDQRLIVDNASGYFYVFYGSRVINKNGGWAAGGFEEHVARAPISKKMAAGSWQKYDNGQWQSPGIGGAESTITSMTQSATGYLPAGQEYNPKNTGTIATQVQNGQLPANGSDLFVMNVSYDAYLGMYIGTPQTDLGDGVNRPLHFYGTTDLATQKWVDLGTTANYTQQSWYRWMLDSANATSSTIVGKTFRSYCYFACSSASGSTSSSEYVNVTIDSTTPAATLDATKSYLIQSASGQALSQSGSASLATVPTATAGSGATWKFVATGDGAYRITNASSGLALGVGSTSPSTRAWGTGLGLTSVPSAGPTVGQQWFVLPDVSTPSASGASTATGSVHLVNRYSGLVVSLTGSGTTVPARNWTNAGSSGDTSTPAAQTLSLVQAPATGPVRSAASNRCLDVPNSSTANSTLVDLWDCNGGANQAWTTAADGSLKVYGNKCLDVLNSSATAGANVGIYDCNGGTNQKWAVNADGTIRTALASGLCLDVTGGATANGTGIELWSCTGGANQKWSLG